MDTPICKAICTMFREFKKYAGDDGIAKGPEVDKLMAANFAELIKNPKDKETCEQLVAKVNALKDQGINKQKYAELLCFLLKAYSEDKVGLAGQSGKCED